MQFLCLVSPRTNNNSPENLATKWTFKINSFWMRVYSRTAVPKLQDDLRKNWCNNNRDKVHTKCNVWNHPETILQTSLWKHFLQNQSMVPKRLGTAALEYLCMCAQSCQTLCDPMDYSLPGSSVHGISQARILEWVAISFSRETSHPRDWTHISWITCTGRWLLYHSATWKPILEHIPARNWW